MREQELSLVRRRPGNDRAGDVASVFFLQLSQIPATTETPGILGKRL